MCATRRGKTFGSTGSGRARTFLLAALLLLGALVQACSDQKGSKGTSFPTGTSGNAETSASIRVQVAINPNTIELGRTAGITVLATNTNGLPLEGRLVQLSTSVGRLNVVDGFTDAAGKFVSALRVTASDVANAAGATSATVTAFIEGASASAVVNFAGLANLFLSPASVTQTRTAPAGGTCVVGGFTTQFTVSGGVPPYNFSNAGLNGSTISSSGRHTVPVFVLAVGESANDVVTVTDAQGNSISATVNVECVQQT